MEKTAKKMFKKLGWECEDRREDGWITYTKKDTNTFVKTKIDFMIGDNYEDNYIEIFSCDSVVEYEAYNTYISPELLKAINQQVRELGWGRK